MNFVVISDSLYEVKREEDKEIKSELQLSKLPTIPTVKSYFPPLKFWKSDAV